MATDWTQPTRIEWRIPDAWTRDGHVLRVRFVAAVCALATVADGKLFTESFGSGPVDASQVQCHFESAIASCAHQSARGQDLPYWLSDEGSDQMLQSVRSRAQAVAFACGVELLPPFELEMDSPTFQRAQADGSRRRLAEAEAAHRLRHAEHALALLEKFEAARRRHPGLKAGQLLAQLQPADRGKTLEALLMSDASSRQSSLWVASGRQLVRYEVPAGPDSPNSMTCLRENLSWSAQGHPANDPGPLRSIRAVQINGRSELLVGAQQGVIRLDPQAAREYQIYRNEPAQWTMGFSAVIQLGQALWGIHGEAGLVGWHLDQPELAWRVIRPSALQWHGDPSARPGHLAKVDADRGVFSLGPSVVMLTADGDLKTLNKGMPSSVVGIVDEGETLAAVYADGRVIRFDRSSLEIAGRSDLGARAAAACALPWLGEVRLLVATEEGPIQGQGRQDGLISRYVGPYQPVRMMAAGGGWVAAISPDRQRVALWRSWDGSRPVLEQSLASMLRHRISDIAFL